MAIVELYHGTIYDFRAVDVKRGKPWKDFGRGFYVSRTESQARRLAIRNRSFANELLIENGSAPDTQAWVYHYEFDDSNLAKLNVKEFVEPNAEWVRFVVTNRSNRSYRHGYDVVIGPTANDDTNVVVQAFMNRLYGDPKSDRAIQTFLENILPGRLP
ncbi:MAG: DUF3990 domain-containing protein [Propionibacteriaceae bacterium]|nr:DUF3990 domain-containing protein [Propionibacteriaceae bacterium]